MHFVKIAKIIEMQIRTGCFPNPVFLMTQYTFTVYYFSVECYDRPRGSDLRTRISLTYRNDINKNQSIYQVGMTRESFPPSLRSLWAWENLVQMPFKSQKYLRSQKNMATSAQYLKIYITNRRNLGL